MTTDDVAPASPEFYLDQALAAFERARVLTDPDESPATYGVVLHDMALVHESSGRLGEAVDLYRRSAAAKRRGSAPDDLQFTLSCFATCLLHAGEVDEAHEVADESAAVLGGPGIDLVRAVRAERVFDLGLLYERLGDRGAVGAHRQALETFEWALSLLDEQATPGSCGVVLRATARLQALLGHLEDATTSLTEALRFAELDDDTSLRVSVLIDLGRAYQRLADQALVPPVVPEPRAPEAESGDGDGEQDAARPGWIAGSDGIARVGAV